MLGMRRPIVFVTDYGRDDAYAASLIGGVWRAQPDVLCIDGTHGVPPGDVLAGAYYLKALAIAFERDVVLCGVVDPGVGTGRRCIAIDTGLVACVAPDNGLVSYLWHDAARDRRRAVALQVPEGASPTFHGRDVFAPAAAQLAAGADLGDCGEPIDDPMILDEAFATPLGTGFAGLVAVVDHFGNAITTVRAGDLGGRLIARVTWAQGATAQTAMTYEDIAPGQLAAVVGSAGHVEIAARGAPALSLGGPGRHQPVTVETA
jgi:S-adenosyl-L-methionine hydrolase (adenosine-forming)